ncbi:MAG: hypothetical protein NZ765_04045, partial [Anaerolineae bacterium]|nr:hypothetical protein [Anaerolineae bacterium]MDW8069990.1 hypothetical protein [Anaerolineae bacterium]
QVLISPVETRSALYIAWQALLRRSDVHPIVGQSGMRVETSDGVSIEVLHPASNANYPRVNDYSLVLRVALGDIRFLLTGDITSEVEHMLLDLHPDLRAAVLKVPHHGSATSSSSAFLRAVQPRVAVLSVAADNALDLPAEEVLQRYQTLGIPLLRTDQNGTIKFITDGKQLWMSAEHPLFSSEAEDAIARPWRLR